MEMENQEVTAEAKTLDAEIQEQEQETQPEIEVTYKNPRTTDKSQYIDVDIYHDGEFMHPFTAIDTDETKGIYDRALSGEFGKIELLETPKVKVMQVTSAQALSALDEAGLLDKVETYIYSDKCPRTVKIFYERANTFERDSTFITEIGKLLEFNDEQIDDLFERANEIK